MKTARRILLAAGVLLGWSDVARATGARNTALNLDRWRMLDSTSIQLTPADMMSFKNIVYGELGPTGAPGDDYAAAFLPVGPGVLGIYAGSIPTTGGVTLLAMGDDPTLSSVTGAPPYGLVPAANVPQNGIVGSLAVIGRVRALYGLELASGMRFAGGISYYSRTTQDDSFHAQTTLIAPQDNGTTKLSDSSSVLGIHVGANLPLGPVNPLAVGVDVGLPSFEAVNTYPDGKADSYKSDSGMDLQANVRARIPNTLGKDMDTMAFVSFGTGTMETTSVSRAFVALPAPGFFTTFQDGEKTLEAGHITIGASNNHRLGDGTVAFYSITYQNTTSTIKVVDTLAPTAMTTTSEQVMGDMPIVIGIESRLAKWLVLRFSSKSSLMMNTTTDYSRNGGVTGLGIADKTVVDSSSSQTFALGLTLDITERVSLEGVLQEQLLFDGPAFVGGTSPGLFSQVSLIARI